MFRKMKLGIKIFIGFAAMIVLLLLAVVFVGYVGLSSVVFRVDMADNIDLIVKDILQARQQEKNFIIRGDNSYVVKVTEIMGNLNERANNAKGRFERKDYKDQMDKVILKAGDFRKAFEDYVGLKKHRDAVMSEMESSAQIILGHLNYILENQKKEMDEVMEKSKMIIDYKMTRADEASHLIELILEARTLRTSLMDKHDEKTMEKWKEINKKILFHTGDMKSKFKPDDDNIRRAESIEKSFKEYEENFSNYIRTRTQSDLEKAVSAGGIAEKKAGDIWVDQKEHLKKIQSDRETVIDDKLSKADDARRLIEWFMDVRINEKNMISFNDQKYSDLGEDRLKDILELMRNLKSGLDSECIEKGEQALTATQKYETAMKKCAELMDQQEKKQGTMVKAARETERVCKQARTDQETQMKNQIERALGILLTGIIIAVLAGAFFAWYISRSITTSLDSVIGGLIQSAEEVASASAQISSASQTLSQGTSEQAASIEETTSSMEEMASMTRQNADNAKQADNLMKEARQAVEKANRSMDELIVSMDDINKASQETSRIIKTIDEIAFQTNLLALNAAVEAARAGEAGAGFAVVADEVRNLAMRSAEAAKNTSALIEGTVNKIDVGSDLVTKSNEAFSEVAASADKVGELVVEISMASGEQARGIEQVNKGATEMDKVTQQNAASAEELASTSEEMNAQAEQMKGLVSRLVALVRGGAARLGHKAYAARQEHRIKTHPGNGLKPSDMVPTKRVAGQIENSRTKQVGPDQIIPLDDEDFMPG